VQRPLQWIKSYEVLIITALHITTVFLTWHMVGPVLPRFALEFGVSVTEVGLLISAFTLARVFLNFPAGSLSERIGRRAVLIAGGTVVGFASIGSGLVQGFPELVALRFLTGAGGALAVTVSSTIMADISTRGNRARMMSFNEGIVSMGLFLGPGVGGLLADAVGLRVPFYVAGALALSATVWAAIRLPETRGWNADPRPASVGPRASLWAGVRQILVDRDYIMIAMVAFATFFTRFGTLFLLLPVLAYAMGMSPGQYGIMASCIALIQVPLLAVAGTLADRVGRKAVIVPSQFLTGAAIIGYGLAPSVPWFLVAAAFFALGMGIGGTAPSAYLADIAPSHLRGVSIGLYRTTGDIAGFFGPLLLGLVADHTGPGTAVSVNGLLVCAIAGVFAVFARETLVREPKLATPAPGARG
jgi:MFS transporter, DHA1 family, multidrug resistance protein